MGGYLKFFDNFLKMKRNYCKDLNKCNQNSTLSENKSISTCEIKSYTSISSETQKSCPASGIPKINHSSCSSFTVDRQKIVPFLIRLFPNAGPHRRENEYFTKKLPKNEL